MPASKPRLRRRAWACRRCWSPATRRRSARCRATHRSAAARRGSSSARSMPSAARWRCIADRCSLHARFLNESKGPAVRALRQQMDKPAYARAALAAAPQPAEPYDRAGARRGSRSSRRARCAAFAAADGSRYLGRPVVLATGTFLGGKSFRGDVVLAEGRFGEAPAIGLAAALRRLGFPTHAAQDGHAAAHRPA